MEEDYLVKPNVKHCSCAVDLCGRAGRHLEALELTQRMVVEKDEGFRGVLRCLKNHMSRKPVHFPY